MIYIHLHTLIMNQDWSIGVIVKPR